MGEICFDSDPGGLRSRLTRGGARLAALGVVTLDTARQLRASEDPSAGERARSRARVLFGMSRRILALHGIEVDARGAVPVGATIIAANHVSWLDVLVVASFLPLVPISRADLSSWPVIGHLARELGAVFCASRDPGDGARVLRAAGRALAADLPVLDLSDGTTTEGGFAPPFAKGLFGLARTLKVPVFPAAICYEPRDLEWVGNGPFVTHYLKLAVRRRARAVLRFGPPLFPSAHGSGPALAAATRERVPALLDGAGRPR